MDAYHSTAVPLLPLRLLAFVAVVAVAGVATVVSSAASFASSPPSQSVVAGLVVLLGLAAVTETVLVPVAGARVTFSAVFLLCAALLYGTVAATIAAAALAGAAATWRRQRPVRAVFNTATAALSATAAGAAVALVGGGGSGLRLLGAVLAAAAAYFLTNVLLVSFAASGANAGDTAAAVKATIAPLVVAWLLAVSIVPLYVVAWQSSRVVALSALFPLAAVALYLRSVERGRQTLQAALTDPLTGIGNRRHFDERLQQELDRASPAAPLTLCLLDLDDLKTINDRHGHVVGDATLAAVARCLRHGGEAFRVGGDEFALLLVLADEDAAARVAAAVADRVARLSTPARPVSVSVGTATYRGSGTRRNELVRDADDALYRAKRMRAVAGRQAGA